MASQITAVQMQAYRRGAQERHKRDLRQIEARRERAWLVAKQAAVLLREDYGATRIVAFGSLAGATRFNQSSDVDLAVWGLPEKAYFQAVARVLSLDPAISVDLVVFEEASPSLRSAIEREGFPL
jgi:predicted nucleotidyltransferase